MMDSDLYHSDQCAEIQTSTVSATKSSQGTTWKNTVIQARHGNKLPKNILKNFSKRCQEIFLEKMQNCHEKLTSEKTCDFQQEVKILIKILSDMAEIIQNDKNYDPRMKIICMDVLIDDLADAVEKKFTIKASHQDIWPKIFKKKEEGYVLEKKAVIENLCLRGGGGKGFGYAGVLEAFEKEKKLDRLKAVSGSSAGAIAAIAVGFGIPPEKFGVFSDKIQSGILRKKSKKTLEIYPAIKDMFSGYGIMGSAAGVIEAIDRETTENVQRFLKKIEVKNFLASQRKKIIRGEKPILTEEELDRLEIFQRKIKFPRMENDMLTFNDIEILIKIQGEGIENNFKKIIITGWDATDQRGVYFCANNPYGIEDQMPPNIPTPHMPIAYAVRISMSLPVSFQSVSMDLSKYQENNQKENFQQFDEKLLQTFAMNLRNLKKDGNQETIIQKFLKGLLQVFTGNLAHFQKKSNQGAIPHKFEDGGLIFNSPNEVFIKPISDRANEEYLVQYQDAQSKTLTCIFDEGGKGFSMDDKKFNYSGNATSSILYRIFGTFKSMSQLNDYRKIENEKLDATGNILVVGHGKLKTLSMSPTPDEKKCAFLMSYSMALDWLRQHEDEIVQIESTSLDELLKCLSEDELQKVDASDWDTFSIIEAEIKRRQEKKDICLKNADFF